MATPAPVSSAASNRLDKFRAAIRRAVLMSAEEVALFESIPNVLLERILDKNFNGNTELAERVMFHRYDLVAKNDKPKLDARKRAIPHAVAAATQIVAALEAGTPLLFLTDNDNDGSMAQAVLLEFMAALPSEVRANVRRAYAQPIGADRGLNIENVDSFVEFNKIDPNAEMLLVTADIGINNRAGAEAAQAKYPNLKLIVTDHHLPAGDLAVRPDDRTVIVNPKVFEASTPKFFQHHNISGADTLATVLRIALDRMADNDSPNATGRGRMRTVSSGERRRAIANIDSIASWSNLLDYVEADVADMPIAPHEIDQALSLRALLNVSNSLGILATLDWSERDWKHLKSEVPTLDTDLVRRLIDEVKGLNIYAHKLLAINRVFNESASGSEKDFYEILVDALSDTGDRYPYESSNPNYIAQLRPHIFRLSVIENKQLYANLTLAQMVGVYKDMRRIEGELMRHLRGLDLLTKADTENATTVWPTSAHLTRLFPRKLLNKVYNEENKGFFLTLDRSSAGEWSGSMRSLFPIEEILPDKAAVEDMLGADILILGHSKAAGVRIQARPGVELTEDVIRKFTQEVSARVAVAKAQEDVIPLPFLSVDFGSAGLVHRINTAVRAHLSNMAGLPAVVRLGSLANGDVFITDSETDRQVSLAERLAQTRYGYLPIKTDFHGGAFIAPTELLRRAVEPGSDKVLALSYMDDGVFIGHRVVDAARLPLLTPFFSDRKESEALAGYYSTTFAKAPHHVVDVPRESLANLPYFRHNKHGAREFERMEGLILDFLDSTGRDVLAVVDTEGTGLGRAPKCFNIGATNLMVEPGSGLSLSAAEFAARVVQDPKGQRWLLPEGELAAAVLRNRTQAAPNAAALTVVDAVSQNAKNENVGASDTGAAASEKAGKVAKSIPPSALSPWVARATAPHGGLIELTWPAMPDGTVRITNQARVGGRMIINRRLSATGLSWLVRNKDMAVTPEIANLTGLSDALVRRLGSPTDHVDRELAEYYGNLQVNGHPARIIFSAHNLPYDKGIVAANFNRFNHLMAQHLLCDTAKIARSAKLAYDDTPVSRIEGIGGLPAKTYFYDSPYSTFSLSTFLNRAIKNPKKAGLYPDISGNYLLKYNPDTEAVTFIDRRAHTEFMVDGTPDDILRKLVVGSAPDNAVKYSVESLSRRAMVRNILLHKFDGTERVDLSSDEAAFAKHLEQFQDQYHFDSTLDRNIAGFLSTPEGALVPSEMLADVGARFLEKNRTVQALFHDGWMVAKVLDNYEPETSGRRIPADTISQIAYTTSLPEKKVRGILNDVIAFKKAFGIQHALVHEQHNNIRQTSANGLGLADTVYESVITPHLALQKFFNPYTQSAHEAVEAIVATNVLGAMRQLQIKAPHTDGAAVDSFSMRQMAGYERDSLTDQVAAAQGFIQSGGFQAAAAPDGSPALMPKPDPIRFGLGADVLVNGSAVYATPRHPLTREEISEASRLLREVIIYERTLSAANLGGVGDSQLARIQDIVHANDDVLLAHRTRLMEMFSQVDWNRRDKAVDDLSKLIDAAAQGAPVKFTADLIKAVRRDERLTAAVDDMCLRYDELIGELTAHARDAWVMDQAASTPSDGIAPIDDAVADSSAPVPAPRYGFRPARSAEESPSEESIPLTASAPMAPVDEDDEVTHSLERPLGLNHAPMLEVVRSTLAQVVLASSDEAAMELMETRRRISRKVQKKTQDDEDAQSVVRDDTFLPELDMRSPIPMAYLLRVGGARALGRYLLRQKEDVELAIQNGFDPKLAGARRLGEDEASVQAATDRDLCEHDAPVEEPAPKSRRRRGP